jgi:hypothetical protein
MQSPSVASSLRTRLAMMQNRPFNAFCKLLGPLYDNLRTYTGSDIRATRQQEGREGRTLQALSSSHFLDKGRLGG